MCSSGVVGAWWDLCVRGCKIGCGCGVLNDIRLGTGSATWDGNMNEATLNQKFSNAPTTADQNRAHEQDYVGRMRGGLLEKLATYASDEWDRRMLTLEIERRASL